MKSFALQATVNNSSFEKTVLVQETTNYEIFQGWRFNRELRSTNQLEEDLLEIGYMVIPVIVDSKFNIYDGHHRVRGAMNCAMPVRYIIDDNIKAEQIKVLNRGQKNWSTNDQIDSYAKQGKGDYRAIKLFMEDFKGTAAGLAMTVLNDKLTTWGNASFKNGEFKLIRDAAKQRKIYEQIYHGLNDHKIRVNAKFIYPLMQFMKHADFDFEWFCRQFQSMKYIIPKSVSSTRTAVDLLRDILNRQAKQDRKQLNIKLIRDMEDRLGV